MVNAIARPGGMTLQSLGNVLLRLRREGVPAYEGVLLPEGGALIRHEPAGLGQASITEQLLLAEPSVVRVESMSPGTVCAYERATHLPLFGGDRRHDFVGRARRA